MKQNIISIETHARSFCFNDNKILELHQENTAKYQSHQNTKE